MIIKTLEKELNLANWQVRKVIELIDDEPTKFYTVTVRRRPIYTISFKTQNDTQINVQNVEEGSLALAPTKKLSKEHYEFSNWDYDFTKPITQNTEINAIYTPIKYKATFKANGTIVDTIEFSVENFFASSMASSIMAGAGVFSLLNTIS